MDTVTEFLDKILFWHWGIVAVALGALEMLFAGGILMGAAIAALLVGAAALADQQFPGALPPEFKFGIVAQGATFLVLTFVFAVALRLGRHRAAAMIAKASEKPAEPAAPVAPMSVTPLVPTPPTAEPQPPKAAPRSPQPPAQPLVSPPPPPPGAPAASLRPATARPLARPAGNQPMRVTGPTAISQQPTPPPSAPRPVRPPARPPAPVAQPAAQPAPPPAPPPKPVAPAAKPRTPPPPPAAAAAPAAPAKPAANPKDFVGKEYTLWKPIAGGKGSLRIAGTDWVLKGPDVAAGSRVRIVGVEGQALRVEAAS